MLRDAERRWIANALAPNFNVTWESDRRIVNTDLYAALLKPSQEASQTFGFDKEIPFFHSPYSKLQPRSMQAMEQACGEHPLAGRIDPAIAFFHSPDPDLVDWVSRYQSENPEARLIVPITTKTLDDSNQGTWPLLNQIKRTLFIRDLFDYKLPLKSDRFFYGREDIVAAVFDNVRKSQNSGIFGLRKTGKTSVLLKVQRSMRKSSEIVPIFFDCKSRPIRRSSCDELALRVIQEIDSAFGRKHANAAGGATDVFDILDAAVQSIPKRSKVCLIFDEIEYISPISPLDSHWTRDFIDFWQALWTIQSTSEKVCYIVCGVNPTVCDIDRFDSPSVKGRTVQNPMFSIFNTYYLQGFSRDNLRNMIRFFGSRMGINFSDAAIDFIHEQYGGHPLLSRLACSFHHDLLVSAGANRPVTLDKSDLVKNEAARDAELSSYCGHVVSEIAELYPGEYELLRTLASGEIADFAEFARSQEYVRHIRDYGLVRIEPGKVPAFQIPVVKRYLRRAEQESMLLEEANRFGTVEAKREWLTRRSKSVIEDLVLLDEQTREGSLVPIYSSSASLRGHQFVHVPLVENEGDAISFLVHCHKHLIEPADKHLKRGVAKNEKFASQFPELRRAFMRLKSYRNKFCHSELSNETETGYLEYLREDFEGVSPSAVEDGWFKLQRVVLDHIHVALQAELSKL